MRHALLKSRGPAIGITGITDGQPCGALSFFARRSNQPMDLGQTQFVTWARRSASYHHGTPTNYSAAVALGHPAKHLALNIKPLKRVVPLRGRLARRGRAGAAMTPARLFPRHVGRTKKRRPQAGTWSLPRIFSLARPQQRRASLIPAVYCHVGHSDKEKQRARTRPHAAPLPAPLLRLLQRHP